MSDLSRRLVQAARRAYRAGLLAVCAGLFGIPPSAIAQDEILDGLRRGEYRFGRSADCPSSRIALEFGPVLILEATRRDHSALHNIAKSGPSLTFGVTTRNEADGAACRWRVTIERLE